MLAQPQGDFNENTDQQEEEGPPPVSQAGEPEGGKQCEKERLEYRGQPLGSSRLGVRAFNRTPAQAAPALVPENEPQRGHEPRQQQARQRHALPGFPD